MPDADPPWREPSLSTDERVEALLLELTLAEKVAQLGSYWPQPASDGDDRDGGDVAPMEHAFEVGRRPLEEAAAHGLGHITRVFGTAPVEPREGVAQVRRVQELARRTRLAIPVIVHEECLTGFTTLGATVYPVAIAWGATFDPQLVREMAAAIGADMHAVGVQQGLSPVLDVVRDYRWGRVEESIGEDPYLVATLATAYVEGLQSSGVIATLKHFAGYSASRAGRNHAPVSMGARELSDVVLPPFEMAVRLGEVGSVMNSYSDLDGVPAAAHSHLLTTVLREQWGFEGTVVSDYWAIPFLHLMHRVVPDRASSGALALSAGIDIELPETDAFTAIPDLVASGDLDEAVVDRAVRRVLRQKVGLGMLDPGWSPLPDDADDDTVIDLDSAHNRTIARAVAEASVILLSNDGLLPLSSSTEATIAVVGPSAADPRTFLGSYSFPNHVLLRYPDAGLGVDVVPLLDALGTELPAARLRHAVGVPIMDADPSGLPEAVAAAQAADVCIVAVGDLAGLFGAGTSGEGSDASDLSLPGLQADLVEAVLSTGTPVVLVVVSGRPYALGAFAGRCGAIVQSFMPGEEGGPALAGVLSGRVTPAGRLPVGVPDHPGGQPGTYLAPPLGRHNAGVSNLDPRPLFPFGHGITYTDFAYGDLELDTAQIDTRGQVEVSVTVRNTGAIDADEVVQLYLSDEVAQVVRPVRELVGYLRVPVPAQWSRQVTFTVHAERTSFTGIDGQRIIEPGWFTLGVGRSCEDIRATARLEITGETRTLDSARVMTTPARIDLADTISGGVDPVESGG